MQSTFAFQALLIVTTLACASPAHSAGLLMPRGGVPLKIKHHRVSIDVVRGATVTTIDQVFVNEGPRALEATYLFPLPKGAVLSGFELQVGGVMKRGEVLEKGRAEGIYQDIVRSMKDPGLVDWMGEGLFRARIFPVPARGTQRIRLRYSEVTPFEGGTYHVEHPLALPHTASRLLDDLTIEVRVEHTRPIRAIYSPSHDGVISREGERRATVSYEGIGNRLDRDFVLHFGVSEEDVGLTLLTHRAPGEPGFFTLLASPRSAFMGQALPSKRLTFILDTSGSMDGHKLQSAQEALSWCVEQLALKDRFNIIRFSSDVERLSDRPLEPTGPHKALAQSFIAGFRAAGGTAIDAALGAVEHGADESDGRPHFVVFITDGMPTVGETNVKRILERMGGFSRHETRAFVLGIGERVETVLLEGIAAETGGASAYIRADTDLTESIEGLFTKLSHPVLTGLTLEFEGGRPFGMLPSRLPALFKGEQLVLSGRYRGQGKGRVLLSASMNGAKRTWEYQADWPKEAEHNAFTAPLWAKRQVGQLLEALRSQGESPALREEIVQLGIRYGIVTPYTSYLVTEGERTEGARTPRRRPGPASGLSPSDEGAALGAPPGATSGRADFGKSRSGASALRDVTTLKRFQSSDAARTSKTTRYVAGRTMRLRGGAWEQSPPQRTHQVLRVAAYSPAWLEVQRLQPRLKGALALGDRVTVNVGVLQIIVSPDGDVSLSPAQRRQLSRASP